MSMVYEINGIDSLEQRPGVPMENDPPVQAGNAHWAIPEKQIDPGNILKRKGLDELTPVFGTAVPPRGISGMLRRAAYNVAEHETSHWALLLIADRVDALEGRVKRALPFALPIVLLGVAGLAIGYAKRRS